MINLKKIFHVLFSLFLLYRLIELMKKLLASQVTSLVGIEIFFIGFMITLYITGVFAFPGFVFPTNRVLPERYYQVKHPDKIKWWYNVLGVKYFKTLLLVFFWGKKNNRKKYFDGTKNGLQNFIYQTKQSEFGHLAAFVAISITSIVLLQHGYFKLTAIVTLINIIGNLYPVILQRHHRSRIGRLAKYYKG